MKNFDSAAYPVSTASIIAGINPGTARSWIQHGWLKLSKHDLPAPVAGATAQLSPRRILQMAVAAKLVTVLNMHPEKACKAASEFTDLADPLDSPGFQRFVGEVYENSLTYLAAYPDGSAKIIRTAGIEKTKMLDGKRVQTIEPPSAEELLFTVGRRGQQEGCWLLPLNPIVKHVEICIGRIDRGEVLG